MSVGNMGPPALPATAPEAPAWLPLVGQRVRVRALRDRDLRAFHAYRSDAEVARFQGWSIPNEEEALAFIRSMEAVSRPVPGQWVQLAIALAQTDELVGDIGILLADSGAEAQVGYSCASRYQRQGLTSEALQLVLARLASLTACRVVRATVDSRNLASERLLIRLGFSPVDARVTAAGEDTSVEVLYELHFGQSPAKGK